MAGTPGTARRGPGRPPGTDKVQTAIRLPAPLLIRLRERARAEGVRVTDLIRSALAAQYPPDDGGELAEEGG